LSKVSDTVGIFIVAVHCMRQVRHRLVMLFWHYADRFGKVTADGIHVPLALAQADLAELVGAARPSVSVALRELADAGEVWRLRDRTWMLSHHPPTELRDARTPRRTPKPAGVEL
jgi:CRP/FNR family transcriptional regulator, cyclic AMP receptor protein